MKIYKLENPYLSEIHTFATYEEAIDTSYEIYKKTNLKCKIKEILIPSEDIVLKLEPL